MDLPPFLAFLVGLFFLLVLALWVFLPFAVFGIKKHLKAIEENTKKIEEGIRLITEKAREPKEGL